MSEPSPLTNCKESDFPIIFILCSCDPRRISKNQSHTLIVVLLIISCNLRISKFLSNRFSCYGTVSSRTGWREKGTLRRLTRIAMPLINFRLSLLLSNLDRNCFIKQFISLNYTSYEHIQAKGREGGNKNGKLLTQKPNMPCEQKRIQ